MAHDPELAVNAFLKWFEKYVNDQLDGKIPDDPGDLLELGGSDWNELAVKYQDSLASIGPIAANIELSWFGPAQFVVVYMVQALDKSWSFNVDTLLKGTASGDLRFIVSGLSDQDIGRNRAIQRWITFAKLST